MPNKPRELHPTFERTKLETWFRNTFIGYSPKLVGSKAIQGRFDPLTKRRVNLRVKSILTECVKAKIGVMGDLESRMDKKDYRTEYDFVQRVYKTKSKSFASQMEVHVIKKFKTSFPDVIENDREIPAMNMITYNGFYYVYVVHNS